MTRTGRCDQPPTSLPARCATVAGLLAEHAYTSLSIEPDGNAPRPLLARQTDLPGELLRSLPCTLRAALPARLEIRLTATALNWTTDDHSLAESLALALC